MPRRKRLSRQTPTINPPAKVPKLSELSQPAEVRSVAYQRIDSLINPVPAGQGLAMASGMSQTESVEHEEGKLWPSADAVAGAEGFAGDSQPVSEEAGVQGGPKKRTQRGKRNAGKDLGGKRQQATQQPAQNMQAEFGNSYSHLVRQHRRVNQQGVVLREDTDDSVRSTDDLSSAGISDAGSGARGKMQSVGGGRPAQRTITFFRKPAPLKSSPMDSKATAGDSTDSITEASGNVGERRKRRRKKKPLPSGPQQLESSETKPDVELLEDDVHPTPPASRAVNQRESVSSDEIGNAQRKNYLLGSPKSLKSTRPRQRSKRYKQLQALQRAPDGLHTEKHGNEDSSGPSSTMAEAATPVHGVSGVKSNANRRGDLPLSNQGRGNRWPPSSDQTRHRFVTSTRKKSTEMSLQQNASADPNSTQMSSNATGNLKPTSTRRTRMKIRINAKKAEPGLMLLNETEALVQAAPRETSGALQSIGAGEEGRPALNLTVLPYSEGQGRAKEKCIEETTGSKAGANTDKIPLPQRKRSAKTKKMPKTVGNAEVETKLAASSKGRAKLLSKTSDKARMSTAVGSAMSNLEEKAVSSGDTQKGKRTRRRKRKLLSSSAAGNSAPSESVGAEDTAEEVAECQPVEIVPKKKKGGKDAQAKETAKGKGDKKAVRKPRPKILPDSLLSLVTAFVKKDPSLAKKLGKLSIAEEVWRKTEHALSGRKHRSSESDCPPEDSKKAKLSSGVGVDEDGVPLSLGESSDSEATKTSAVTVGSDVILGIVSDILLVPEKDLGENTTSAKMSKKKKNRNKRKKKKAKHSGTADNEEETDDKDEKKMEKQRKIPPNYFVAMRVDDPEIQEGLQKVQRNVALRSLGLMPALLPLPTLHLTLAVLHLASQEDMDRTKAAMDRCCRELRGQFPTDPLAFHVSGMDNFRNQVVFARVKGDQGLQQLKNVAATVEKFLCDEKLLSSDSNRFKAHITLMKLSKAYMLLRRKGIKAIPPETYSDFLHADFGVQYVHKLQLCAMMKQKQKDGYYHVEHEVDFAPETGETTRLQKFCRSLVRKSMEAALQKMREERGLTAEAEREMEMLQLSKSIVAFSVQSAVAQLKAELWEGMRKERGDTEKRDRKERRKKKRKKNKGAKAGSSTEAVQSAERTESLTGKEGKVEAAAAISGTSQEAPAVTGEAEQAGTEAVTGEAGSGETPLAGVGEEEADNMAAGAGGGQMGNGGEREGPVGGEVKDAQEGKESLADSEAGEGNGNEKEGEEERGEEESNEKSVEEEGDGLIEGSITPAELDAFCKKLVEECVEEALQRVKEEHPNSGKENEDEGTSV